MKNKPNARFGSRYGKRIRVAVLNAEEKYKHSKKCPFCSRIAVRRVSSGVWKCKKCSVKFASGAYDFSKP